MAQDVRRRIQRTVTYVTGGGQETVDISRGLVLRELYLHLTGQPTVTLGNNTQANTLRGDEWACVSLIELIANGSTVIRSITGLQLYMLNYFMYGTPPKVTATIGDGATANPSFDSVLILPMWMFNCIRPLDTALDTSKLSDLKLRITWANYTAINASATGWTTAPQIEVSSLESSGIGGDFALQTVYAINHTITADDPKYQVILPTGEMYRAFMINTTDTGVDEGDIMNQLKIKSGNTVFYDQKDELIRQTDGWVRRGIHRSFDGAAAASAVYDDVMRSDQHNLAGWYFIDLVTDGRLTEAIDTVGFSEFLLELDLSVGTGATILSIIPIRVRPVRKTAA